MKTLKITRKPGPYARARKLTVLVDGVAAGTVSESETLTVQVADTAQMIRGKMDWAKTEAFAIHDLSDGTDMVIWSWWTWNPLRLLGLQSIPMKFDLPA